MTKHIIVTIFVLLLSAFIFESTNTDIWLQDYLYNFSSNTWVIDRNEPVLKFILYDGIKTVFIIFILAITGSLIFLRKNKVIIEYKSGLLIVALSTILIPVTVGALKATTNTPCPRALTHYHGSYPYVTFLGHYPEDFKQHGKTKCFPAGHASGGFALMSLFFLFKKRRHKIIALVSTLIISWAIGFYKIFIGDHFLSHTIDSMILAWLIILIIVSVVKKHNEDISLSFRLQ